MTASVTLLPDPAAVSTPAGVAFLDCVHEDLAAVEMLLEEEIRSDVRAAYAISGHTLSAGGKRLRPALVTLAARAVQNAFPTHTIHASAGAAELIHMASLIHDDVVDNAEERRGGPRPMPPSATRSASWSGTICLPKASISPRVKATLT